MKKNAQKPSAISLMIRAFSHALNSLFFAEDREFQRLKNFIAS
jgi:hypothetical protein